MDDQVDRPSAIPPITDYELLRIITFVERVRAPYQDLLPTAEEDGSWNILLYLVKNHLYAAPVTISALASAAKVPYATAMRRIHAMIAAGHIEKRPTRPGGKSFLLAPSAEIVEDFLKYARRVKSLLAETFGLRQKPEDNEDFYFGGSYFAAQIIPPPRLVESLFRSGRELKFLLNDDNYFRSMSNVWSDFRNNMASRKNFDLQKLPDLHDKVIANSQLRRSAYDIVAINTPWLGEAAKRSIFRPLNAMIERSSILPQDFHTSVWSMGTWNGEQYGVPIYCTIELLAARSDLFERDGLRYPTTFDETVAAAKHFHRPEKGLYGIAWNGGGGMPIASTFMFLMGCCGQPILNLPQSRPFFTVDKASGEQLRPRIASEAGRQVLDYLHRLIPYSPPDILTMDWDRRTTSFLAGQTAMAYCWTVRAARFETDVNSVVRNKVTYLPQPRGPRGASNNPIGGFLLCIPQNLPDDQVELAFEAIAWMASPEAMKANVQNGFPVAPRFSVSADPEAAATSPIVSVVDRLAKRNMLKSWPRPPVPEYLAIERVLGLEIHRALSGALSDSQALENAQTGVDRLMRDAGYY
ncbi:MAG: extracellular solute-binding protein [Ancalomicrobiaceae bacterium]|nr:extracellular solute-binding protein [Ancalomicrobiaceae bacterium]